MRVSGKSEFLEGGRVSGKKEKEEQEQERADQVKSRGGEQFELGPPLSPPATPRVTSTSYNLIQVNQFFPSHTRTSFVHLSGAHVLLAHVAATSELLCRNQRRQRRLHKNEKIQQKEKDDRKETKRQSVLRSKS